MPRVQREEAQRQGLWAPERASLEAGQRPANELQLYKRRIHAKAIGLQHLNSLTRKRGDR